MNRREFIASACAVSAFFAAHGLGSTSVSPSGTPSPTGSGDSPRIRRLELWTAAPLAEMRRFYHHLLGLPIVEDKPHKLTFDAGQTRITFLRLSAGKQQPFYHFAFNIPENKIRAAHGWQKARTPLLPIPKQRRDPKLPDEVVDYRHWNAHSIFFFDPAENVVEYIARHDLDNATDGGFDTRDILYASEIAWVVDDVAATAKTLQNISGVGLYGGVSDRFAAVGDERGLLIVMQRDRLLSFDSPRQKTTDVFTTAATVKGPKPTRYAFPNFPYQLLIEP